MKKLMILGVMCLGATLGRSQTVTPVVLANDGGFSTLSNGSISWSIGEPVSETYTSPNNIHTMGFHQPELDINTLIKEQGEDVQILVFPNPVQEMLQVNLNGLEAGDYTLEMNDAIGKLILSRSVNVSAQGSNFQLKMNEVAAGNYFLRVSGKQFTRTVKITKVN